MQKKSLIPTLLVPPSERRPVPIAPPSHRHVVRVLRLAWFFLGTLWRWIASRVWPPLRHGRYSQPANAQRLRAFAEKMGGLWVKICQLMAMRRDLFSSEFCDELSRLQDRAEGFPPEEARRIIERELNASIDSLFSEFEPQPIAAASIGQIHAARLRANGQRVAIKVQRPDIQEKFGRDLGYVRLMAGILTLIRFMPTGRWNEGVWELEKTLSDELDYRLEATALVRMRKTLKQHGIYVPKPYLHSSTAKVLVMEFVQGVFMSDYIHYATAHPEQLEQWRQENRVNPRLVGKRLYLSQARQIFEDNLFHCDLHPGNILLLRNSRICFIDFGSIGSFERSTLEKYHMFFVAMTKSDYSKLADILLLLSPSLPNRDFTDAKLEVVRMFRAWEARSPVKSLPYYEKSVTQLFGGIVRVLGRHGISSSWEFLRANRAQLTLDASLMFLLPDGNFVKLARRYRTELTNRANQQSLKAASLAASVAKLSTVLQGAEKWVENLYFDGERLRKRAANFEGTISKAADVTKTVFSVLGLGVLGLSLFSIFMYTQKHWGQVALLRGTWLQSLMQDSPALGRWTWLLLGAAGLIGFWRIMVLRHHLNEKDYSPQKRL